MNDVAHRRARGGRMAVRWRGEAVMRRCNAVPSSYVAIADRGGAPRFGELLPAVASFSSVLLPPPSLSTYRDVVLCHQRRRLSG